MLFLFAKKKRIINNLLLCNSVEIINIHFCQYKLINIHIVIHFIKIFNKVNIFNGIRILYKNKKILEKKCFIDYSISI